jgi:hypothetical protein
VGPAEPGLSAADARGRRLDAATGIVAVVLFGAAFVIPGSAPTAADTVDKIGAFFNDKRDSILVADFLIGLAGLFFLWWLGSLRSYLRIGERGEGRLSAAGFLAGGVGVALTLAAASVDAGLAFKVGGQGDQPLIRVLFDIRNAMFTMSGFAFAAMIAAVSCSGARSGMLPAWAYWPGSVIAGLNAAGGAALFAERGFFSAGGALSIIALATAMIWFVALSVLMIRTASP